VADGLRHFLAAAQARQETAVIAAIVLAAARSVAIDALASFGCLCLASIVIAVAWAFLFRHRRRQHINRRGHP
jgi:hypothetical protein